MCVNLNNNKMSKNDMIKQFVKYVKNEQKDFVMPEKNSDHFRIMTFNVHLWSDYKHKDNITEVLELIASSNADVIGLSEAVFRKDIAKTKIEEYFKDTEYKYFACCNPKFGINIVISKYPIVTAFVKALGQDPGMNLNRYAILCRIALDEKTGKTIDIVMTHLDVYDESEKTRTEQIMKILEKPDNDIVMGDFNSLRKDDYDDQEWKKIEEHNKSRNVESVFYVTDTMKINDFITDKINMSVWSMRRVDYIYINKKSPYELVKTFTIPTLISDHLPLVSDIKLKLI